MSNYSSNLKSWGATGSVYPDGYKQVEGEQPVDDWHNFLFHNLISDVKGHLIPLTNDRLESGSGSSRPASPETGEQLWRTDNQDLEIWSSANSQWKQLAFKSDVGTTPKSISLDVNDHDLAAGEYTGLTRLTAPAGAQMKVYEAGVSNGSVSAPAGLEVIIYDLTNNTMLASYNSTYASGTPLNTLSVGGNDILVAVDNGNYNSGSGSTQEATGFVMFKIE